jgi:hypothetical protein
VSTNDKDNGEEIDELRRSMNLLQTEVYKMKTELGGKLDRVIELLANLNRVSGSGR